tara:strand:- start:366 stop:569 length:204 start_codon:yes stop_codon:yes gene_type:complete
MNLLDTHTHKTGRLVTFYTSQSDALRNAEAMREEGNVVKVGWRKVKVPTGAVTLYYTAIVEYFTFTD